MVEFSLSSNSHLLFLSMCIGIIVFLPKLVINKSIKAKHLLIGIIFTLMLANHLMDFYREGLLDQIKLGLPLHLCDFSSASIMLYFLTKKREFFLFAFFAGISGAGMAILTPDVLYAFPNIDYIRHMVGHSMILLGVSYAIIVDNQRPYLKDVHRVLLFISLLLILMYPINFLIGPPANYWYVLEKPPGLNVTGFMREPPFHMIDIYILAVIICYSIYLPYFFKDKFMKAK